MAREICSLSASVSAQAQRLRAGVGDDMLDLGQHRIGRAEEYEPLELDDADAAALILQHLEG